MSVATNNRKIPFENVDVQVGSIAHDGIEQVAELSRKSILSFRANQPKSVVNVPSYDVDGSMRRADGFAHGAKIVFSIDDECGASSAHDAPAVSSL